MKRYNNDNNKVLLDDNIKGADVILEFMKIYDLNDWDDIYDLFQKKKVYLNVGQVLFIYIR